MTIQNFPWASTTNFPAGSSAWSGQPLKVNPNYNYFTPGQVPTAEELNYLLNQRDSILGGFAAAASNLQPQQAPSGFTTVRSAAYDKFRGLWLLGGGTNPALAFNTGGDTWISGALSGPGGAGASIVALGVSPAGSRWYAYTYDGTNFKDWFSADQGATWTNITTYLSTSRHVEHATLGSVPIIAVGGTGSTGFLDYYATPEATPSVVAGGVSGVTAPEWLLKASSTIAVAIPMTIGVGANPTYYTSTNGTTWTSQTFTSGIVNFTNKTPVGLTYNSALGLFVVAFSYTAGLSFYTSPDGITWSATATLTGAAFGALGTSGLAPTDLASVNGLIVGIANDATVAPASANNARLIYSPDGSVTWYWGSGSLTGGTTATQRPRLHTSQSQLLALNSVGVRLGQLVGAPAQALV